MVDVLEANAHEFVINEGPNVFIYGTVGLEIYKGGGECHDGGLYVAGDGSLEPYEGGDFCEGEVQGSCDKNVEV